VSNGTRRTKYYLWRKNWRSRMHVRDAYSQHPTASREHTSMQYHIPVLDIPLNQYLFLSTISSKQERSNHGTNSPESATKVPNQKTPSQNFGQSSRASACFCVFEERGAVTPLFEREILWATRVKQACFPRPCQMPLWIMRHSARNGSGVGRITKG